MIAFQSNGNGSFMKRGKLNSAHLRIRQAEPCLPDPDCACHLANRCCHHDVKQWPLKWLRTPAGYIFPFSKLLQKKKKKESYKIYQVFKSIEVFKDCQALQHELAQPPEVHTKDTAATTNPVQNISGVRKS